MTVLFSGEAVLANLQHPVLSGLEVRVVLNCEMSRSIALWLQTGQGRFFILLLLEFFVLSLFLRPLNLPLRLQLFLLFQEVV